MRLTKLEINGFKSFAKKTEMDFGNGITAIIGPNGSGKSNIADAVRWVLGEQSARALRGAKMEDVIFNGTEQRKPQAFCEVTLTFDNSDGVLPTDFTEVSVTRRVYRSGESEYLINKNACRLKDINELFRDTGIGKEGYSIIGQGKVEEILSNKSGDRRTSFEEAAGVMKYRVRKEEAERKLDNTGKNLIRLNDILEELSKQVGPLEEQSSAAREYLKYREELKDIEINVFLYQYDKLKERISALDATTAQLDEGIESTAHTFAALGVMCTDSEEKERSQNAAISELQNRLLALSAGVESNSGTAKVINEKLANIVRERSRLESQMSDNTKRLTELTSQLSASNGESDSGENAFAELHSELEAVQQRLTESENDIEKKESALEEQKNSVIASMKRLSDAASSISRLEGIRVTLVERISEIEEEKAEVVAAGEKLSQEYSQAKQYLDKLTAEYDRLDAKRRAAISEYNELTQTHNEAQNEIHRMEQSAEAAKARIKVLDEMKRAHEGYYASVKNVLRDSERDVELKKRIEGVVAELIRVPAEYEAAVEMTLGSALQNVVTPNEQDAKSVIEYLRKNQYGRATFLPVSAIRSRLLSDQERSFCRVNGFIGVASELVECDKRYRAILDNLLGRTVIVRDLDAGIAINRQSRGAFRIATLKGDIINPGGSMTGGSTQKREFSIIGRTREIEDLSDGLKKYASTIDDKRQRCTELAHKLEFAQARVASASEAMHARDVEVATQHEKVDIIKKYLDENAESCAHAELELSQINDSIDNIDEQCREAEQSRTGIEAGNASTQEDIRSAQAELYAARTRYSAIGEEATRLRVRLSALEKEISQAKSERTRLEREAGNVKKLIESDRASIEMLDREFVSLQTKRSELGEQIDVERKDYDELTDQLHAMEEERSAHQTSLDEMRARREAVSSELSDMRERRHRAELSKSKSEMELENIQDRIFEDYELTYENAQPFRHQIAVTSSHLRADELKKSIRELGDVNVSAIDDYKNVKERYETMSLQCEDLHKAEADLGVLIADLTATMEEEFSKQFMRIQANFAETFVELFGGGKAELVLSDKNDILNCDIDIIAQPPGKKLQLLSLLSGGERSLTAIALLFAMLKLKPTAFCILDEIEAALDEVNVTNFAEYVKSYSRSTQFILITHRKGSMEVCDSLYGVAMEERGVSKVISAKFNEIV